MRQIFFIPFIALSACAAQPVVVPVAVSPPMRPTGLARVLGKTAAELTAEFGRAELDVREQDARKLQFRSGICVLDAYLYPARPGAEPVATYVDARQPDGRDIDRASCVAAIARRDGKS